MMSPMANVTNAIARQMQALLPCRALAFARYTERAELLPRSVRPARANPEELAALEPDTIRRRLAADISMPGVEAFSVKAED